MERRSFLRSLLTGLGGLAVAETLDFDRLLWEPGKKVIFDLWTPESEGNVFVTPDWVHQEAMKILINNLRILKRNPS